MTALGQPTPEESAYERGFSHGLRFAADYTRPTREVATQAARLLGGTTDMRSLIAGIAIGALLMAGLFSAVGLAAAHDITSAVGDCVTQTIVVTGTNFDVAANSPVTVSRQGGGYSQTFPVTTPDWTHVLGPIAPSSLIPNGVYDVTWPGAGAHAITFQVFCERSLPTPTAPAVTPTPAPTPTPTPNPTPRITETPLATPTGSVVAATGTPKPTQTLPPTDTE